MALVDKYGNFNLAMLMAILPGLAICPGGCGKKRGTLRG